MIKFEIKNNLEGKPVMVFEPPFAAVGGFLSSSVKTRVMFDEIRKSIKAVKNKEIELPFELGFDADDLIMDGDRVSIEPYYGQSDPATLSIDEFGELLDEWENILALG